MYTLQSQCMPHSMLYSLGNYVKYCFFTNDSTLNKYILLLLVVVAYLLYNFACLDFREFVVLGLFTKFRIRELSISMIGSTHDIIFCKILKFTSLLSSQNVQKLKPREYWAYQIYVIIEPTCSSPVTSVLIFVTFVQALFIYMGNFTHFSYLIVSYLVFKYIEDEITNTISSSNDEKFFWPVSCIIGLFEYAKSVRKLLHALEMQNIFGMHLYLNIK